MGDLSEPQWRYLFVVLDFMQQRRPITVLTCCKEAKVSRWTVWRWHQQPAFVEAMNKITEIQVQSRVPLIDYSIQQRALDGSPKHIEAYLRMTGRWNGGGYGPPQPVGTPAEDGNHGVQVGSVTFVNVPIPPTPQQAEALRPPPARTSSRQRRRCRPCQFELLARIPAADERRPLTVTNARSSGIIRTRRHGLRDVPGDSFSRHDFTSPPTHAATRSPNADRLARFGDAESRTTMLNR